MKRLLLLFSCIILLNLFSQSQEKRALLIAINTYAPPEGYTPSSTAGRTHFNNLDGCVNDANAVRSIISSRFLFNRDKIDTLYNEKATRDGILNAMNDLLKKSQPGDVAFIYYAGHGSQVKNSLTKEADGKDETIVPSDSWKEGVGDIRDKELSAIYNKFIDKNVKLTVIMDCCHSGSGSRGPQEPVKARYIAEANYDVKDAFAPVPPETRPEGTFLIMSAAQDMEHAMEQRDHEGRPHGAFTIAFMEALKQQSPDASAINLFTSIRAILKSNGKKQEPVLGGSKERQEQTLFGLAKGTIPDKSLVAILGINDGKVELQGGYALGLYPENELVKFNGKDTLVKVKVETVTDISRSIASVVKGNISDLKPGELLEVTNWISPQAPLLKVYIPNSTLTPAQLSQIVKTAQELKQSKKIKWVTDLEKYDPYLSVYFSDNKAFINVDGAGKKELKALNTVSVLQAGKQDSTLYFELPPSKALADAIKEKIKQNKNILLVSDPLDANYVLYGNLDENGNASYGLRRFQTASRDSLEVMPVRTRLKTLESENTASYKLIADSLYEFAIKLSKVRGWLQLAGPRGGKSAFPFHLELINTDTNTPVNAVTGCKIGDNIALYISADENYSSVSLTTKYIYVFAIDKNGSMTLGYPDPKDGNVHNKFPKIDNNGKVVEKIMLFEYEVTEPAGTDNLFLLATDEPIANFALLFNQEGIRGNTDNTRSAFSDLLDYGNENTRSGFNKKTPTTWSLHKLTIRAHH